MPERLGEAELGRIFSLDEFEPFARARMEPAGFDYVAGGGWDEISLQESVEAWRRKRFIPRVLTDIRRVDVGGNFLGRPSAIPVAMPPMAVQRLAHPDGEVEAVRGAAAAGIPYTLSTPSSRTIEEVAEAAPDAERWFQLYLVGSMEYSRSLVERATAAGYRAIILTVDLPVVGYRRRDLRSNFVFPAQPHVDAATELSRSRYGAVDEQNEIGLSWDRVREIQGWTSLPVILKGILSPEDAHIAVEYGVPALVVSSHGARQLDRVIATAEALTAVVDAVDGRAEVWVDGGIRSGLDVLLALAMGARGVLVGRPLYWALAAGGAAGISRARDVLAEEMRIGLTLLGSSSVTGLSRNLIA
jgi:isopentenyl diphosphate isomerase/L-lactate dehydrogenase-like FMN-dependent dehydrogenase